ncbi:acyl-CoA dehydrogenase family protein [Marinobacter sp.]|uniref:acyl-CoA dehydrogenase family protein n=1 Tax=Marinobacter sp. TaxID=50741 RepID=UPI003A903DD5
MNASSKHVSESTMNATDSLVVADRHLGKARELVDLVLGRLKTLCSEDGKLSAGRLDDHQLSCYELAFCVAELSAADAVNRYAEKAQQQDSLAMTVALAFSADVLQKVPQRLLTLQEIERADVLGLCGGAEFGEFVRTYGAAEYMAALGAQLSLRDSLYLPAMLDDDKEMVRETFARFATDVVMPLAEKIHRHDLDIPDEILKPAAELGSFGISIPERFGGLQPDDHDDSLSMIVVTEELSRASLGAAGSLITRPEIAAKALLSGGTEAQQEKWLPKLASGETLCAISITEPNHGSDVASLGLRATSTEGGWLLNGSKTWCTFAGKAELLVVIARSEPDASLGHKGLSLFLVEKPAFAGHEFSHQQPGGGKISGKAIATLGYRGMHSFDMSYEDYFVPADHLIGEEAGQGKGFYFTMAGFSGGRIQTAARANGVMEAASEKALKYAGDRKVFGQPIAAYQLTQVKLARMFSTLIASRQFTYAVAREMDQGRGQMEASLVKLFSCRAAEWVSREAMQIHGGMGYAEEYDVSRYFVDARVLSIFEGAEETLALKVIARELVARAQAQ